MCDCVTQFRELLKPYNADLDVVLQLNLKAMQFRPLKAQIQLCKLDKKKRKPLPPLVAEYCPFCGTRYEWPDLAEMDDGQVEAEMMRAARHVANLEEWGRRCHAESSERRTGRERRAG